ncbi:alpha/beta fold hydrolase [Streptomyces sp. 6N223]|uniref:alpha/beta fold hydrolase n=1 Tax=Streptomyces sp. 6N223 TaxID=3457412 RepID=UPI003FD62CCD
MLAEEWLLRTPEGSGLLDPLPDPGPVSGWCDWLAEGAFAVYAAEFARTGFAGALRRYRALDADWHELPEVETLPVEQPVLFVAGERDSAYRFGSLEPMYAAVPGLREVAVLPGCGHWTQQERAEEVGERVVGFLRTAG